MLFDLQPTENDKAYQTLQVANLKRKYSFLNSIVQTTLDTQRVYVSQTVIKAFNFQALVCLHAGAGEYRPCEVKIGNGEHHKPPMWIHVQSQMDDLVNQINRNWDKIDPIYLAAYALWRLNWIHPFVNGNGRTARVTAYYILCLKFGGMLEGEIQLPELLRRRRGDSDDPYVAALRQADNTAKKGAVDLTDLHILLSDLLKEQLESAKATS